jgi:hypothetical protein
MNNSDLKTSETIDLINAVDNVCNEYLGKGYVLGETAEFSDEVNQIVSKSNLNITTIIRYCDGYTVFMNIGGATGFGYNRKVLRIAHNQIVGEVEFENLEGMQGNYIQIIFFKDFYCVFHNWRGCSYGDYAEPYVCVYDYVSLQRKIKIKGNEANVRRVSGRDWDDITESQNRNFDLFYQCLDKNGFDTDAEIDDSSYIYG